MTETMHGSDGKAPDRLFRQPEIYATPRGAERSRHRGRDPATLSTRHASARERRARAIDALRDAMRKISVHETVAHAMSHACMCVCMPDACTHDRKRCTSERVIGRNAIFDAHA